MNFEILLYKRITKFQISKVSPYGGVSTDIHKLSEQSQIRSSVSPWYAELEASVYHGETEDLI